MPLSVFAALELRPGPDSSGVWLNGSAAEAQVERGAAGRPERQRREKRLGALARRVLKEPRRRARLIRRWWFGRGERGWKVEVSADGVPHPVRRGEGEVGRGEEARTARRERFLPFGIASVYRAREEGKRAQRPNPSSAA